MDGVAQGAFCLWCQGKVAVDSPCPYYAKYLPSTTLRYFPSQDHAFFMGWVGLWYALSQGVLAKVFIQAAGEANTTKVLLVCVAGLGLGRVAAMLTTSLVAVYALMGAVIVALGVVNTAMAAAGAPIYLSSLSSPYLAPI